MAAFNTTRLEQRLLIKLISPFPKAGYSILWSWLNEYPEWNFDDLGPDDFESFVEEMEGRKLAGETVWGVEADGDLCGAIGYLPITPYLGTLHGVCFASRVHGTGIAAEALGLVLDEIFGSGVEKIQASYFADNYRVHRFLQKLGFVEEGLMRRQGRRDGQPIDMRLAALFKEV